MDAEYDLDDLVCVICTGDILAGADILDLTQPLLTPTPGL